MSDPIESPVPIERKPVRTCGAKTRAGGRCRSTAVMPNGRCRIHGGQSPRGIEANNFRHGRYSKAIPARLAVRYEEALKDAEWASLKDEISLLTTRLQELLAGMGAGDAPSKLWSMASETLSKFQIAQRAGNITDMKMRLAELETVLATGAHDALIWDEIRALAQDRRKLVESERKRLVEMQQVLTTEQAHALIAGVLGVLAEEITDTDVRRRVGQRLVGLTMIGENAG